MLVKLVESSKLDRYLGVVVAVVVVVVVVVVAVVVVCFGFVGCSLRRTTMRGKKGILI